ncbi:MAG: transcriptional regulator, partial [Planctomycetes bacterium]|nr:transcriptional regulator [Planctomycetota bacterium]
SKQISVLDVVNAVDALERIRDCPLGIKSHEGTLCNLHRALDDAIATIERAFGSAMLGDLIEPGESGGLCSLSPKVTQLGRKSPTRPARK